MKKPVQIIGIPIDLGQSLRGVDMGPGAMRYAGLTSRLVRLGYSVQDLGNLEVPVRDTLEEEHRQHYLPAIRKVCETAYLAARNAIQSGNLPIFLGGDHSLAIGTIGGVTHDQPCGILWIDAHGDFNTPQTSHTGNIHGMPLAALLGYGYPELVNLGRPGAKINAEDVVMIGIRDLDREERTQLSDTGICVYTMRDIDERGMSAIIREALVRLEHHSRLHVSLDIDCLDPSEGPGVGTPSSGGLTYREAQLLMEIIADSRMLTSLDIVEINPILDHRNQTAEIAVDLAASLFGKSIL